MKKVIVETTPEMDALNARHGETQAGRARAQGTATGGSSGMRRKLNELLRDAAEEVAEVAGQLDRSENPCSCCGTSRKTNWAEFQMGVELDAMVRKLRAFAGQLDK